MKPTPTKTDASATQQDAREHSNLATASRGNRFDVIMNDYDNLERRLGIPNIPALLAQEFLTPERREQLNKEYQQIRKQSNTMQRFYNLTRFATKLQSEQSIYQVTGTAMDMQHFTQDKTAEQQINSHVRQVAQESGWKKLITHVASSYENKEVDKDIRAHIEVRIGKEADNTSAQQFIAIARDSTAPEKVRLLAITGLRHMAHDSSQDNAIREEARANLRALSHDTQQDAFLRHEAIRSLGNIGGTSTVVELGKLLTDTEQPDIRHTVSIELCKISRNTEESSEASQSASRILVEKAEMLPDVPEIITTLHEIALKNPEEKLRISGRQKLETIANDEKRSLATRRLAGNTIAIACIEILKNSAEVPTTRFLGLLNKLERHGTVEHITELEEILQNKKDLQDGITRVIRTIALRTFSDRNASKDAHAYATEKLIMHADIPFLEKLEAAKSQESTDAERVLHIETIIKDIALNFAIDTKNKRPVRRKALGYLATYAGASDLGKIETAYQNSILFKNVIGTHLKAIILRIAQTTEEPAQARILALKVLKRVNNMDEIPDLEEIIKKDQHPDVVLAAKSTITRIALDIYAVTDEPDTAKQMVNLVHTYGGYSSILDLEKAELDSNWVVSDTVRNAIKGIAHRVATDRQETLAVRSYALAKFKEYNIEEHELPIIDEDDQTHKDDRRQKQHQNLIKQNIEAINHAEDTSLRLNALTFLREYGNHEAITPLESLLAHNNEPDFIYQAAREAICDIALRHLGNNAENTQIHESVLKKLERHGDRPEQLYYIYNVAKTRKGNQNTTILMERAIQSIALKSLQDSEIQKIHGKMIFKILGEYGDMSSYIELMNMREYDKQIITKDIDATLESIAYRTLAQENERGIFIQRSVSFLLNRLDYYPEEKQKVLQTVATDSSRKANKRKAIVKDTLTKFIADKKRPLAERQMMIDSIAHYKNISVIHFLKKISREKKPEEASERKRWDKEGSLRDIARETAHKLAVDFVMDATNPLAERQEALTSLHDVTLSEVARLERLARNPAEHHEIRLAATDILCKAALKTLRDDPIPTQSSIDALNILKDFRGDESIIAGLREYFYQTQDKNIQTAVYKILSSYDSSALLTSPIDTAINTVRARIEPPLLVSTIKDIIDTIQTRKKSTLTASSIREIIDTIQTRTEASLPEATIKDFIATAEARTEPPLAESVLREASIKDFIDDARVRMESIITQQTIVAIQAELDKLPDIH